MLNLWYSDTWIPLFLSEIPVEAKNMFEKYLLKKYKLYLSQAAEASDVTRQGGDGPWPGAATVINDSLVPGQHFTLYMQ